MPHPKSTARIAGHPIHPMLVSFPIAFFAGTLACDLIYVNNPDPFWLTATLYLLGAGVVMALVAAVFGFIDFLGDGRIRAMTVAWGHMLGNLLMVLLQAINWYRRYDMGEAAIPNLGISLSVLSVLIMLVTGWLGWEMVYRRHVAVAEDGEAVSHYGEHAIGGRR
jgi:uncharacterized membrane protein